MAKKPSRQAPPTSCGLSSMPPTFAAYLRGYADGLERRKSRRPQ